MTCPCKPPPPRKHTLLGLIATSIVLALVPKCPLCFVGYVALFGLGISVSTAIVARYVIIVLCVLVLALLVVRTIARR